MIFWTKIRDKMIFWRFPKSVSVLYNYGLVLLRPADGLPLIHRRGRAGLGRGPPRVGWVQIFLFIIV